MPISTPHVQPELQKAFELFMKELDSHIFFLQNTLQTEDLISDTDNKRTFEHRFHTIRGGAGFLQLHEIQACAAQGEKIVRDSKAEVEDTDELRTHLERIVETLNTQMNDLREAFGEVL